jgi:hypothetical protein
MFTVLKRAVPRALSYGSLEGNEIYLPRLAAKLTNQISMIGGDQVSSGCQKVRDD